MKRFRYLDPKNSTLQHYTGIPVGIFICFNVIIVYVSNFLLHIVLH